MTDSKPEATRRPEKSVGDRILDTLRQFNDALEAGGMAEVEKRFVVTRVPIPPVEAADLPRIRKRIGATRPVFAGLIGVSVREVRGWETGTVPLTDMARTFIGEIRMNADYWKAKAAAYRQAAARTR